MQPDPKPQMRSFSATGRSCDTGLTTRPTSTGGARKREPLAGNGGMSMLKVKLRPWDGIALADAVLAEARQAARSDREAPVTSSPRVAPALRERDAVESAEGLVQAFMVRLAADVPEAADVPAVLAVKSAASRLPSTHSPLPGQQRAASDAPGGSNAAPDPDSEPHRAVPKSQLFNASSVTSAGRSRSAASPSLLDLRDQTRVSARTQLDRPTSSFAAPARDKPDTKRAPAVGQYNPRDSFTQRRVPSASISRAARPGFGSSDSAARRGKGGGHQERRQPTGAASPESQRSFFSVDGAGAVGESFGSAKLHKGGAHNASRAGITSSFAAASDGVNISRGASRIVKPIDDDTSSTGGDADRSAANRARCGTPQFASRVPRFGSRAQNQRPTEHSSVASTNLLIEPGSARPSTAGTFSKLARKGAFEDGASRGTVCFTDKSKTEVQPKCFVSMARETSRSTHKGKKLLYTGLAANNESLPIDTSKVDPSIVLSTKQRPPSPANFDRMSSRPSTPAAADRAPLAEQRLDPPRGFVDISRMTMSAERTLVSGADALYALKEAPREALNPNPDVVLRRAPSPVILKGEKPSAFGSGGGRAASALGNRSSSSAMGGGAAGRHDLPPRPSTVSPDGRRSAAATAAAFNASTIDHVDFNPTIDPVRRRAPSPSMKGTDRAAPVMRETRDASPSTVYDARLVETHVGSPSIRTGLSRHQRDRRFKKQKAVDAVYDVKPDRVVGGALAFAKYKGRQ